MKRSIVFIALFLISVIGIKAQEPLIVSEENIQIGNSSLPGLSVTIPDANYEKTMKAWVKYLRSGSKSKVVTEKDEMTIFGAKIKDISNPVNVYSKLLRTDSGLKLSASFELKKNEYIERSADGGDFAKAQNYLQKFSKDQYLEIIKAQADIEAKKLRDIEKKLSSLERDKSRMQKSIRSDNTSVVSEKANIAVQENELTSVAASIAEQSELLTTMESGPDQKEKSKLVKDLKSKKKKIEKSLKSSKKKIKKTNSASDKATLNISGNERMQNDLKAEIAIQKKVYQGYLDQLKTIKSY